MAVTVGEFLESLEAAVPLSKAAGWDNVGLQVGDMTGPADRVAVTHEVSDGVLDELEQSPADLLIAYHPLLFRPQERFVAGGGVGGRAFRLARQGVSLAIVHTAFDVVRGGAADSLAATLGLADVAGFGPLWPADSAKVVVFAPEPDAERVTEAMASAGGGRIGAYTGCSFRAPGTGSFHAPLGSQPTVGEPGIFTAAPEVRIEMVAPKTKVDGVVAAMVAAHRYEEPAYDVVEAASNAGFVGRVGRLETPVTLQAFARRIGERLDTQVRVAGSPKRTVARAAVVPGSGSSLIGSISGSADVLVTGDVTHHRARMALDQGIAVVDAGHTPTERPGLQALYSLVSGLAHEAIDMTHIDPNPWKDA